MLKRPEVVLKPVMANAGLQAWYRRKLEQLIRDMAKSMLLHVRAAYRDADLVVGFATDAADASSRLRRTVRKWSTRWRGKFDDHSRELGQSFAGRARSDIDRRMGKLLKDAGFTVKFSPSKAMTQAYQATIAEQVNLIKSIPAQFLKDVQTHVWGAVMKGSDLAGLTKSIEASYGVSHRRAALIARDQNAKARAIFEEARRSELGITEAIWLHSSAGKVPRPTHVAMSGKRYDIKRGMWDPAIKRYVWPGTEINCRCSSRAVIN